MLLTPSYREEVWVIDVEPVYSPCGWQIERARRIPGRRGWPDSGDYPESCWQRQRSIRHEDMGIYAVRVTKTDGQTSG
jgi:hypothetical protein